MEIIIGIIIFIMGTFFGSFFTLAVYRIPLGKDITHERSFCPNCNHKLSAFDLIPVWSYLLLGGKCRYCKEKIRIRYLFLEVLSGLVFLAIYIGFKGEIYIRENIEFFIMFVCQYITLVLVAGIDKEHHKIQISVLIFGVICQLLYMLYLYIVKEVNMYRYIIYFIIFVSLFLLNKKKPNFYPLQVLLLLNYSLFAVGEQIIICFLAMLIIINFASLIKKCNRFELPLGYIFGICTICYLIVDNILENYYFN